MWFLYIRDNTLLAVFCSWMTCSWTVRMLCLNSSGELGSWPWWWSESWIVWDMNGCDGFENEKVGNGFTPEMKRWGAGSIYWMIFIMETGDKTSCLLKRSCKSVQGQHLPQFAPLAVFQPSLRRRCSWPRPAVRWSRSWYESFVTRP